MNRQKLIVGTLVLVAAGCGTMTGSRDVRPQAGPVTTQNATPQVLIDYVNRNASKVESLEATDLALEVKQGSQGGGLSGSLSCQKPRDFRLRAKAVGKPVADFGSNENEFWYWISQDNPPYLYHCTYAELSKGNVPLPFPFQPDWVLETLGMAVLNAPADNFRVERKGNNFELVERSTSLQGKTVFKTTVFDGRNTGGSSPQIIAHRLHDEKGELVATAEIVAVRRDAATGATVPQHLRLKWPQQKIEMDMKLDGLKVYNAPVLTQRAPELFQRQTMRDVPTYDLAKRGADGSPTSLQRTGGVSGR